jgi:hypothetical protein
MSRARTRGASRIAGGDAKAGYAPCMWLSLRATPFVATLSLLGLAASLALVSANASADGNVDANATRPLFALERNKNANFVQYEAKIAKDGAFDPDDPILAYWVMAAEDRRREPLSAIEKALAFGFSARPDKRGNVWLTLVAHKSKPIRVFKDATGVHAELGIAGRRAYLTKMFVQAGPEFIPKVIFLDLFGTDAKTGAPLHERITPAP